MAAAAKRAWQRRRRGGGEAGRRSVGSEAGRKGGSGGEASATAEVHAGDGMRTTTDRDDQLARPDAHRHDALSAVELLAAARLREDSGLPILLDDLRSVTP
uniref:Uncharacterized protein n=1 Tax=Oryza sativa subsp. japonica TaxID=39947 RepID=Q6YZN5_ORYSJ|nr:hypothetical protein [Oryza sativa Japonica Group]BAD03748.1 hypothetical protein [Oryza sativa Japonica Group]